MHTALLCFHVEGLSPAIAPFATECAWNGPYRPRTLGLVAALTKQHRFHTSTLAHPRCPCCCVKEGDRRELEALRRELDGRQRQLSEREARAAKVGGKAPRLVGKLR
eukprot:364015-Chlamydomonas_euryale.AAC.3